MNRPEQKVMHHTRFPETNLMFGRMDIDIDQLWRQRQEQHVCGMTAVEQHILVSRTHRVGNQLVLDHTTIDEKVLLIRLTTGVGGPGNPTLKTHLVRQRRIRRTDLYGC